MTLTQHDAVRASVAVPSDRTTQPWTWAAHALKDGAIERYELAPISLEDVYVDLPGARVRRRAVVPREAEQAPVQSEATSCSPAPCCCAGMTSVPTESGNEGEPDVCSNQYDC